MPKRIDWRELAFALTEEDGNELLDSKHAARVTKANSNTCTICADPTKHSMKYQLLRCKSANCKNAGSGATCGWRGKVLTCTLTRKMALYETGTKFSTVISPRRAGLTRQQKRFCQELVGHRLKSVRFRTALRVKFGLEGDRLPRLRPIQNFVNYYSKTQLGYNDDHERVTSAVRNMAYDPSSNGSTPITFT
ncbi:unnamed protein product [Phytophthora lilii]|uniref:Unnamed protein product n=1 Tax=Phytophthora lilii TaxID=2077276 RepID=A0A9W6X601_9STRA|nr:unnamed protein product [Phytophthora lilii]